MRGRRGRSYLNAGELFYEFRSKGRIHNVRCGNCIVFAQTKPTNVGNTKLYFHHDAVKGNNTARTAQLHSSLKYLPHLGKLFVNNHQQLWRNVTQSLLWQLIIYRVASKEFKWSFVYFKTFHKSSTLFLLSRGFGMMFLYMCIKQRFVLIGFIT